MDATEMSNLPFDVLQTYLGVFQLFGIAIS